MPIRGVKPIPDFGDFGDLSPNRASHFSQFRPSRSIPWAHDPDLAAYSPQHNHTDLSSHVLSLLQCRQQPRADNPQLAIVKKD
jgi:hypothetical protein